jgi:hypothetical protein
MAKRVTRVLATTASEFYNAAYTFSTRVSLRRSFVQRKQHPKNCAFAGGEALVTTTTTTKTTTTTTTATTTTTTTALVAGVLLWRPAASKRAAGTRCSRTRWRRLAPEVQVPVSEAGLF